MRTGNLHIFYWCAGCHEHKTNWYPSEQWQQHQADLEDAKRDDLICPVCEEKLRQQELGDAPSSEFYEPGPYQY